MIIDFNEIIIYPDINSSNNLYLSRFIINQ